MDHDHTRSQATAFFKDEAFAVLAHELRSPLAALLYSLDLVRAQEPLPKAIEDTVVVMERQVRYMTRIIEDVLDLARADRDKLEMFSETFNVQSLVADVVETCHSELVSRSHQLNVSLPPHPIHFDGDRLRIRQVLVNLLTNAARYTLPGGRIGLSVERVGSELVFRICDNGIGIDAEFLVNMFKPYTQGTRTQAGKRHGIGIGLALVKCLVELHGGSLEVCSSGSGQGTEFVVRLPCQISMRDAQPVRTQFANDCVVCNRETALTM